MTETSPLERAVVARWQLAIGLSLMSLIVGTIFGIHTLARHERVIDWIEKRNFARAETTKRVYLFTGGYTDFEDHLTLKELPTLDSSEGGVYVIGSSDAKWGFATRDLPEAEQRWIHNVGIGATNHEMQGEFVRFLVEKMNVLSAAPEKTLFVFATSYHTVAHVHEEKGFFPSLWQRYGVYTYDKETGIGFVDTSPFIRKVRIERAHIPGFLHALKRPLDWGFEGLFAATVPRVHTPTKYNENWQRHIGPDFQGKLETQTQAFLKTARDLKVRGAFVTVVLLPQGTWEKSLPYERAYSEKMKSICAANDVPLVDLVHTLDDEDFSDASHLNTYGQARLLTTVRDLARKHRAIH